MYFVNKIAGWFFSPMGVVLGLLAVAAVCLVMPRRRVRLGFALLVADAVILCFFGCNMTVRLLESGLEKGFPAVRAEDSPSADAIVVLGGGMQSAPGGDYPYADMSSAADRVWHAARLYRAGKAPLVVPTGSAEETSAVPLLCDLGVPREAIAVENHSRNTEENAKFVAALLEVRGERPKVLLVTSVWHMRRALLMYRRYAPGLDIVPAPTDYEMSMRPVDRRPLEFLREFVPNAESFYRCGYLVKEYVGYWGYRLLRR